MSDTLRDLDAAVQRHIAEAFPGEITDAWILISHSNGLDDNTHDLHNYRMTSASDSQPHHVDAGLVSVANRIIQDSWDYADHGDDDD